MTEQVLISYFARLEYNYKKKYLFSASIRRDGSSTFGEHKKWGTFPSVAAAWTFSEEGFIRNNLEWFNFGKIRASSGTFRENTSSRLILHWESCRMELLLKGIVRWNLRGL